MNRSRTLMKLRALVKFVKKKDRASAPVHNVAGQPPRTRSADVQHLQSLVLEQDTHGVYKQIVHAIATDAKGEGLGWVKITIDGDFGDGGDDVFFDKLIHKLRGIVRCIVTYAPVLVSGDTYRLTFAVEYTLRKKRE